MIDFPISPEKFWTSFSTNFRNEWAKNPDNFISNYLSNKDLTNFITKLLLNMKSEFNCEVASKEYWPRVDIAYFNFEADEWGEWALEAAIEHENMPWPSWQEECRKLMLTTAGLKTLISYRNESEDVLHKRLKEFQKIFKSRKYHQIDENWLFIFGPTADVWDEYDFVAYKFDGTNFTDITGQSPTFHE